MIRIQCWNPDSYGELTRASQNSQEIKKRKIQAKNVHVLHSTYTVCECVILGAQWQTWSSNLLTKTDMAVETSL